MLQITAFQKKKDGLLIHRIPELSQMPGIQYLFLFFCVWQWKDKEERQSHTHVHQTDLSYLFTVPASTQGKQEENAHWCRPGQAKPKQEKSLCRSQVFETGECFPLATFSRTVFSSLLERGRQHVHTSVCNAEPHAALSVTCTAYL